MPLRRCSRQLPTANRVIPDGLEPSLPGCKPGVVAAGPRDRVCACLNGRSGSRGTRTHNGFHRACFRDRALIRPDDFRASPMRSLPSQEAPSGNRTRTSALAERQAAVTSWARLSLARSRLRSYADAELSRSREHRAGVEPAPPPYEGGVRPAGPPVHFAEWDQRGSNPHPPG